MIKRNYLYALLALFVIGLVFVFYYKIKGGQLSTVSNKLDMIATKENQVSTLDLEKIEFKTKKQDGLAIRLSNKKALSKPETFYNKTDATFDWQTEHLGYYYTGIMTSDYDNYDLNTLKELGQQGDMHALDVLAWRYKREKNYEAALSAYHSAAILGSTAAIEEIARLTSAKKGGRERYVHLLSYLQTAVLRGDQQALTSAGVQMKVLNDNYKKLTPLEIKNIQQQGLDRYSNLEHEREKMGLSKFDNTTPEYTKQYYLKARELAGIELDLTTGKFPIFITKIK